MWERKKEKRKMFKEKNENEGERKVLSEGKIRFQKISLLFDDCFSDKVFQRCCCCSNTAQQHVKVV